MKTAASFRIATLAACAFYLPSMHAQTDTTGQTMLSPFFELADYASWTLSAPWRDDGEGNRLVMDVAGFTAAGFYVATGTGVDLRSQANITALDGYDPETTRLTGFDFATSQPFVHTFVAEGFGGGEYNLYFEVTVTTSAGDYRAVSDTFINPFEGEGYSLSPTFTWAGGPFLGDPLAATGGGIALNSINSITYSAVMHVVTPNTGPGTAFFTLDNMSLAYLVSSAPVSLLSAWRETNFPGSTASTGTGADEADADNDGIANLLEYATGTDPKVANAEALSVARVDGNLNLSFNHIADPSLIYVVEATDDLGLTFASAQTYTGLTEAGTIVYEDTATLATTPRRFLRLTVCAP